MKILRIYLLVIWVFTGLSVVIGSVMEESPEDREESFLALLLIVLPTLIYIIRTHI